MWAETYFVRQKLPEQAGIMNLAFGGDFEVGRLLAALGRRLGVGGVGVGLDAVALRARDSPWQTSRKQPSEGEEQASKMRISSSLGRMPRFPTPSWTLGQGGWCQGVRAHPFPWFRCKPRRPPLLRPSRRLARKRPRLKQP